MYKAIADQLKPIFSNLTTNDLLYLRNIVSKSNTEIKAPLIVAINRALSNAGQKDGFNALSELATVVKAQQDNV